MAINRYGERVDPVVGLGLTEAREIYASVKGTYVGPYWRGVLDRLRGAGSCPYPGGSLAAQEWVKGRQHRERPTLAKQVG